LKTTKALDQISCLSNGSETSKSAGTSVVWISLVFDWANPTTRKSKAQSVDSSFFMAQAFKFSRQSYANILK
jgi:hypothetical protein